MKSSSSLLVEKCPLLYHLHDATFFSNPLLSFVTSLQCFWVFESASSFPYKLALIQGQVLAIAFSLAIVLLHSKLIVLVDTMQGKVPCLSLTMEETSRSLLNSQCSVGLLTFPLGCLKLYSHHLSVPVHFSYLLSFPC